MILSELTALTFFWLVVIAIYMIANKVLQANLSLHSLATILCGLSLFTMIVSTYQAVVYLIR